MTEQEMIYRYIKSKTDDLDLSACTFNDIDIKSTNSLGVFIKGSQVTSNRRLSDGTYIARLAHIVLNLNCNKTKAGIFEGVEKLEKLRNTFEREHNGFMYFKNNQVSNRDDFDEFLNISQIELMSDIVYLGKNSFEIPGYSLRIKLTYIKGGN